MITVIKIENLWKEYRLGVIGHGTLTQDLQSWWAKLRGREDPNRRIPAFAGQEKQVEGNRFWALRDINLSVKQGEVLGIIGKNGAGKSTLLKLLSRVTAPTAGEIRVKGRIASLLEVGTGFHPELTGRENVYLNGAIMGMSKFEINKRFDEIVAFSGVDSYIDTPVKRYSSGMYVRLAFAVAAHLDPEILIIDEVLAVGDAEFQKKCLGKMKEVSNEGRTVLFVSHIMPSVKKLCTRVVLIENGRVTDDGPPEEIVRNYIGGDHENSLTYISTEKSEVPYIISAAVSQEGMQKEIFDMDRQITIDFEIDSCGRKNTALGVVIRDQEGMCIHHSSDEFKESGKYSDSESKRQCRLPAYALRKGKYIVDLSLGERNVELYQSLSAAVSFEVDFTGKMSDRVTGEWQGVCGPGLIQWQ